jgi:hypothetical protein
MEIPNHMLAGGLVVGFVFLLLMQAMIVVQSGNLHRKLAKLHRLEGKLDLLLDHHKLTYNPFSDLPEEVQKALHRGNKIEAIRHYREATGATPKEAKDFIEVALLHRFTKI